MVFVMVVTVIIAVMICIHYSNLATDAIIEKRKLQREINSLKAQLAKLTEDGTEPSSIEKSSEPKPIENNNEITTPVNKKTPGEPPKEVVVAKAVEDHHKEKVEHVIKKIKNTASEEEKKNTSIMATGAILVILAAIVFLSSTWSILSNVAKTIGLLLFLFVFAEASKISKERYHLEKASKTFFYLAMAYIPICFISISLFGLLGEFLSIYGDGVFIYFFLSSCITAMVYYYFYYTKSDVVLFYGSLLSQAAAMVLFVLIFSNDIRLIMSILLAYNIVLAILCSAETYKLLENIVKIVSYIAFALSLIMMIENTWLNSLVLVLLALNYLILYLKFDNDILFAVVFNASLCAAGGYWIFVIHPEIDLHTQLLIGLIYNISISVIEILATNNNDKHVELQKSVSIINFLAVACLYLLAKHDFQPALLMIFIEDAFLFFTLLTNRNKDSLVITNFAIPIALFFTLCEVGELINTMSFTWVAIILCLVGELFRKTKYDDLTKGFMIIGGIVWGLFYVLLLDNGLFIDKLMLLSVAVFYLFRTKKTFYKYLSYLGILLLILWDKEIDLIVNWKYVAPAIITLIVATLETAIPNLRDNYSKVMMAIGASISYSCLSMIGSDVGIAIAFLFSVALYFYYVVSCNDKRFRLVPLIWLFVVIRMISADLMMLELWEIMYVVMLTLITVVTGSISYESICSGLMLFIFLGYDLEEKIISSLLYVLWSVLNLITATENEKMKDSFTALTILSATYFYYQLTATIGITEHFVFPLLIGVVAAAFVLMEKIVKKYVQEDSYLVLEYIVYGIICFISLFNYKSEIDGMFFVLFWIMFAIMSYNGKRNGRFLVSILSVLVNAFLLTRKFWFSLPWWIYLLFAGMGMIGFAIKNEFNSNSGTMNNLGSNNNEKISIGQKDNIENKK